MKKNFAVPTMVLGLAALAAAQSPTAVPAAGPTAAPAAARTPTPPPAPPPVPTKVGIINMAGAIYQTKEGQDTMARLQAKFAPVKEKLDKRQADIQAKTDQLRKGSATLSPEAQANLKTEIDKLTTGYNRDMEDAQTDSEQENGKVMNELGAKMMEILNKYGADNGYAIILDVSDPNTQPVRYAPPSVDITADLIKLYDQKYPMAPAPAAAAPKPGAPAGAATVQAPKPAATPPAPPTKKQ